MYIMSAWHMSISGPAIGDTKHAHGKRDLVFWSKWASVRVGTASKGRQQEIIQVSQHSFA